MESLAPELLESIFLSACTDGGFTGCALSLVSKRIRAASYSARYFSVALLSQSPTQLHKFLAHLVRERAASPATARPRIRHLYLSSAVHRPPPASAPGTPVLGQGPGRERAGEKDQEHARCERVAAELALAQTQWHAAVGALLALAAPDLRTLTLAHGHRGERRRTPELAFPARVACAPGGFPCLRELTVAGPAIAFEPGEPEELGDIGTGEVVAAAGPLFPALKRVHFVLVSTAPGQNLELQGWAARAPALTRLRVSHINFWPKKIVDSLATALASGELKKLERIIVQPHATPPIGGYCGTPHFVWTSFMERLEDLCAAAGQNVVLLPNAPEMKNARDWTDATVKPWLDGIVGEGVSCWDVNAVPRVPGSEPRQRFKRP